MRIPSDKKLIEYIGAYGFRGSRCASTSHLCEVASVLFAIEKREEITPDFLAETISGLGKKERSRRARRYLKDAGRVLASGQAKPVVKTLDQEAESEWVQLCGRLRGKSKHWNTVDRETVRSYMRERHGVSI